MDALRKVYHRAVQIPLDNVERLWQELEAFETGLNKITASLSLKGHIFSSDVVSIGQKVHGRFVPIQGPGCDCSPPTSEAPLASEPSSTCLIFEADNLPATSPHIWSRRKGAHWAVEGVLEVGGEQSTGDRGKGQVDTRC
jgi:hypothetical protein